MPDTQAAARSRYQTSGRWQVGPGKFWEGPVSGPAGDRANNRAMSPKLFSHIVLCLVTIRFRI